MAHEIIALQIATLLLEEPTDDSVELTCTFMQECGFTQWRAPGTLHE